MQFDIELQADAAAQLAEFANIGRAGLLRAIARTTRKTAQWGTTQISRATRAQVKIPAAFLKRRLRAFARKQKDGTQYKIFLGGNVVNVGFLGKVSKSKKGVRVAGQYHEGAFAVQKFGGKVYRRPGKERFPLEPVVQELQPAMLSAVNTVLARLQPRFVAVLRRELNFELSKATKKANQ